ncbi:hypothetical protein F4814DRAFT_415743 [Daldinia grandis]|nr:hypothetical protein F4814DRAFT_415743 [Daldinia grandis]
MKFLTVLTFVAAALAYGVEPADTELCTPPAYICKSDFSGWLVCNVDGNFLVSNTTNPSPLLPHLSFLADNSAQDGGDCPTGTVCQSINNLPYCI